MPTTKEGLQRLLDFFVYGMLRAAESLGNAPLFLRTVEEEGLRKFLLINFPKFQASENPTKAASSRRPTQRSLGTRTWSTRRSGTCAPTAGCARCGTTSAIRSIVSAA